MQLTLFPFSEILALSTLTLATTSREGIPHAAPVYFVAVQTPVAALRGDDTVPFLLYFLSEPDSQHCQNTVSTGLAAGAVYPDRTDWREIRGLQLRGRVRKIPEGPEWEAAFQAYRQKFPFVGALKEIVAQNVLYAFKPTWIRMVDNRRGFGFKQEWSYPDENA